MCDFILFFPGKPNFICTWNARRCLSLKIEEHHSYIILKSKNNHIDQVQKVMLHFLVTVEPWNLIKLVQRLFKAEPVFKHLSV